MEVFFGLLALVTPFAVLYAITRTDESVAYFVDRWGPTNAAVVYGIVSFFALPVIGAVVFAALTAYLGLVRALYEWGALTLRMIAVGGFGFWITAGFLFPHGWNNPWGLAPTADAADPKAGNEDLAAPDRGAGQGAPSVGRNNGLQLSSSDSGPASTTTQRPSRTKRFASEFLDLFVSNPGSLPWELTGPEAAALRRPAPENTGAEKLPEPEGEIDSLEAHIAAAQEKHRREFDRRRKSSHPPTSSRPTALDLYREGKVPNNYAAMLTVWGEALQALDRQVLAELTHPNARGILRKIANKTIDDATLEGLRARYQNARHERWIRRGDNEYVAVVRLGGLFGPKAQFVCRLYQKRWRLYQITDSGLQKFLENYRQRAETPLGPDPSSNSSANPAGEESAASEPE